MTSLTRFGARVLFGLILSGLGATSLLAQGVLTATLSGVVESADGKRIPGATVSLASPALQGERATVTDANGSYIFRGLPPGQYKVKTVLTGFAPVERSLNLAVGETAAPITETLKVAGMEEAITVTAEASSLLSTPQIATSYEYEKVVDKLATNRTLAAIAELAPGLTDNGPNLGQVTIGGAFAYDNVFLLNGVDVNDNLFGTANNLFIEDALQEITVLTSGISAEYGRFSGGVINAVTKIGGNEFSGSFRTDVTNPDWIDESRTEKDAIAAGRGQPHPDDTSFLYTATLGGPVVKDRLWFFGAYRRESSTEARALSIFGTSYSFGTENRRYEGKLTGRIAENHRVQANYIKTSNAQTNLASLNTQLAIDSRTLIDRDTPNSLFVASYDATLGSNVFAEARYSQKKFGFRNGGGTSTDIIDSPFRALGLNGIPVDSHYGAPYFSSLDPEDRDNKQYAGAVSYFLSTGSLGRHDLKLGAEYYTSSRTGGNSQSATGFVFQVDPVVVGGIPQVDGNGRVVPNFQPGTSRVINFRSLQGAKINLNTFSVYLNDRWQLDNRWSFNAGVRMERHSTDTTQAGIASVSSSAFVPRLGATFDVKGDGKWILQATYGHYAGKASETQFADNTNVGTPSSVTYQYAGPAGQGIGFAPGFNLANYTIIAGNFPIRNVFLDDNLNTPITKEWTLQAGTRLGSRGEVKAVYIHRKTTNFLEDFITIDLGKTVVQEDGRTFGTFDNTFIKNTDDGPRRAYEGLLFTAFYRPTKAWTVQAHWTVQLKNEGNFEGEAANQPGNYSIIADRPEFYSAERHYPLGRTDDYQKSKLRLFSLYDVKLGKAGTVTVGATYAYDSPVAYSLIANNVPISAIQRSRDPGYARPPTTQTLFFGVRGSEEFEAAHLFNFSLHYDVPVYKKARPFFKAELRNAFNKQPLIGYNITVAAKNGANDPKDALGLPLEFTRGALFGTPQNNYNSTGPHVPFPREVRFSLGFRF